MYIRREIVKASGPGNPRPGQAAAPLCGRLVTAMILAFLLTPTRADATVFFTRWAASSDTSAARPASAPSTATTVLMMVRETSHRLLETPDTRILRYTARFPVSHQLAEKIVEVAHAEGLDPELAFRLIRVESRFHERARSPQGALGLTQVMPSTARRMDRSLRSDEQILDPRTNLQLGFRYLRTMIDRYGGDVRLALLAYNRGPGAVDRALAAGLDPENGYSRKVLGTRPGNRYEGTGVVEKTR
jgi:soluble lytic murein transglycosylase-like protein